MEAIGKVLRPTVSSDVGMTNLSDSLKLRLEWKILQTNGLTLTHPLGYLLERQSPQPVFALSCEIARRLKRNGVLHSDWSRGWVVRAIDVDSDAAKGLMLAIDQNRPHGCVDFRSTRL
jgi:hypothetical protein